MVSEFLKKLVEVAFLTLSAPDCIDSSNFISFLIDIIFSLIF